MEENIDKLKNFRKETFKPLKDDIFLHKIEGGQLVELKLISVDAPRKKGPAQVESFSLLFSGCKEIFLPQQTYKLEHSKLGSFSLFLVPVGQDKKGYSYEAVFSRIVTKEKKKVKAGKTIKKKSAKKKVLKKKTLKKKALKKAAVSKKAKQRVKKKK